MPLLSASGGLVYHCRALCYRRSLWAPFRRALGAWLEAALPVGQELILVGPSAGHCLPLEALGRNRAVLALEPDPLARQLLRLRLSAPDLCFDKSDLLVRPLLHGGPGLDRLLRHRPSASVLFCNVLGQVQLDLSEAEQQRFVREFQLRLWPELESRVWVSFHDYWSLAGPFTEALPAKLQFTQQPSDDELGRACFGRDGPPVTLLDHGTAALFPKALPRSYFGWQLTPAAAHIIEGVSSPSKPGATRA